MRFFRETTSRLFLAYAAQWKCIQHTHETVSVCVCINTYVYV